MGSLAIFSLERHDRVHLFQDALAGGRHIGRGFLQIAGCAQAQGILEEEPLLLHQPETGLDLSGVLGRGLGSSRALANSFIAPSSISRAGSGLTPTCRKKYLAIRWDSMR